jgi:2-polyprenyl-3-methyl-5-hydroxy-6-metoxy-1,4-benzoquinol methylase
VATTNPERDQDRAYDLYDNWTRYGYVMFPQQRSVYRWLLKLAADLRVRTVLEVGCGSGQGSALFAAQGVDVVATDKLQKNVEFAQALYPWVPFQVWDVTKRSKVRAEAVMAVEVLEHVADAPEAMRNMIDAATREVWLSTPNGRGKSLPPTNPYHVTEFRPTEVIAQAKNHASDCRVEIRHWETFRLLDEDTDVDPLIYRVIL